MPEWGTRPANHYLPRQKVSACGGEACSCKTSPEGDEVASVETQVERGELHLASIATRV
jgi:hypothetical protein